MLADSRVQQPELRTWDEMGPLSMEEPGLITPNSMTREIIVVASDGQLRVAIVQAHRVVGWSVL